MAFTEHYSNQEPSPEQVTSSQGPRVIEFGTDWCGFCRAAQPLIEQAFAEQPELEHLKIEDGKGRRLGRHFRVKLWPTLIFLRDGEEVGRVVRPNSSEEIAEQLQKIS